MTVNLQRSGLDSVFEHKQQVVIDTFKECGVNVSFAGSALKQTITLEFTGEDPTPADLIGAGELLSILSKR